MKSCLLLTTFAPEVAVGAVEAHYGVSFTAVETEEEDGKGKPIMCLMAELEDDAAETMATAGRVRSVEDKAAAEIAAAEKAAAEKAVAEKAVAEKAAAEKAAAEKADKK
jgi:flagellar biosynthesis GTPase FlhF